MPQKLAIILIFVLSMWSMSVSIDNNRSAFACSCTGPKPAGQALVESKAVFSGKAEEVVTLEEQYSKVITFIVDRAWKGDPKAQVTLVTAENSAACGYNFETGKSYLVYSYQGSADSSSFSVSLCSSTKPIDQAEADLAVLGAGYAPTTGLRSIDVNLENKTYTMFYNMSSGGLIDRAEAVSHQPYGGELLLYLNSSAKGFLEVSMPRELFDQVGFTDHFEEEGLTIIVNDIFLDDISAISSSCDKIIVRIPIESDTEEVALVVGDILSVHDHFYPPTLHVTEKIVVGESEFNVHVWTSAIECNVSFSKEEKKLHIDIAGKNEMANKGHFSIMIPNQLLGGNYTVLLDGIAANFTQRDNASVRPDPTAASLIIVEYEKDTKSIDVIGTSVIPEFSSVPLVISAIGIAYVLIIVSRFGKLRV